MMPIPVVGNPVATMPKPFLKWPGGKSRLLETILPLIPQKVPAYHEVCLGGGTVFFGLRRRGMACPSTLYDLNPELIRCYQAIQQQPDKVIKAFAVHADKHSESYFLSLRQQRLVDLSDAELAARMIYLNRAAYNGLYRVDRQNQFNVPWGRRPTVSLDAETLVAASHALQNAELVQGDFASVSERAVAGDLIYIDPPYPGGFVQYTSVGFDESDHLRLGRVCRQLHGRDCLFLQSNADTPFIRYLYRDFHLIEVKARRSIASQPSSRGLVSELLIMNF